MGKKQWFLDEAGQRSCGDPGSCASSLKLWKQPHWKRPLGSRKEGSWYSEIVTRNSDINTVAQRISIKALVFCSVWMVALACVLLAYPRDYISKLCKRHKPDGNCSFQNNLLTHMLTSFHRPSLPVFEHGRSIKPGQTATYWACTTLTAVAELTQMANVLFALWNMTSRKELWTSR